MLIDTHSHLYFEEFKDDLKDVVKRAVENGVTTLFTVGVDVQTSQIAQELENNQVGFYSTIGIHPHNAFEYSQDPDKLIQQDIERLTEIYHSNPQKVIAVGECGLDYMFENNPDFVPSNLTAKQLKQLQQKLLIAQVNLARRLNLPLMIHCRDNRSQGPANTNCWEDTIEIIKDRSGILHCYSGLENITQKALKLNFLFSFAATITYPKNDYLRQAVKLIPLEKICLETDCPFLPPQGKRGQRNEPSTVKELAETVAQLKQTTFKEVAGQTTNNVYTMFKIDR